MKRYIFIHIMLFLFIASIADSYAMELTSYSSIVIDNGTGNVYYEYNADIPLAPASMTKIMTVYLIYEEMNFGNLSKDTLIAADYEDHIASIDPNATNVLLEDGVQYSIDELLGAIIVPSACASAAMVGKYISGSEAAFAEKMTQRAQELGLTAYFEDASGLSDANRITARSTAELVRLLINQYPDVLNYTSKASIIFHGKTYNTTNRMLSGKSMEYLGVDGFKTGTTTLAGACFAGTAYRDGIRINTVTMHSDYGLSRFDDTRKLLDHGFVQAELRYGNIYSTDMKVYINGYEVPAFAYTGDADLKLVILAEDLKNYGFNTFWNAEVRNLNIKFDPYQNILPIDTYIYHQYEPDTPLLRIYDFGSSVTINHKDDVYSLKNIYDLNGYLAISADELGLYAKSVSWENDVRSLYMDF